MNDSIRAKKSLGQNFLKDPLYLCKIADAAQVCPEDQVLEIGPGLGHLTAVPLSVLKRFSPSNWTHGSSLCWNVNLSDRNR